MMLLIPCNVRYIGNRLQKKMLQILKNLGAFSCIVSLQKVQVIYQHVQFANTDNRHTTTVFFCERFLIYSITELFSVAYISEINNLSMCILY